MLEARARRAVELKVGVGVLAAVVTAGMAGGCVLWLGIDMVERRASIQYCMVVSTVLAASVAMLRLLQPPSKPESQTSEVPSKSSPPNADLYFLEYRLSSVKADSTEYEQRVRPLLAHLAEGRLMERHRISRHHEPEKARLLLGDQLWELVTGDPSPGTAPPSARRIAELVELIEAI